MLGNCVAEAAGDPIATGQGETEGRGTSEGLASIDGACTDVVGKEVGAV